MYRRYRDMMPDGAKSFANLGMKQTKIAVSCFTRRDVCDADDSQNFEHILSEYLKSV